MKPQTIAAYITALSLVPGVAAAQEATGSVELMTGQNSSTIDTTLTVPIAPRLSLFTRNRFTGTYETGEDNLSSFHIFSSNFNLKGGLDLVAETDLIMPAKIAEPRIGFQYFKSFGDFGMFNYTTVSCKDLNVLFATNLSYNPMFTDLWGLSANLEAFTDLGPKGHNFSGQRLRLAPSIGGYKIGFAADFSQNGIAGDFDYNFGGFAKRNF